MNHFMKSILIYFSLLIYFTAPLSQAQEPRLFFPEAEMGKARPSQSHGLVHQNNLLQVPARPKVELKKQRIDLLNSDQKSFQLVPKNKKVLQGPDLTAGANLFEKDLNELLQIISKALLEISTETYSFLRPIQWVIVPEDSEVIGPDLKKYNFAGRAQSVSLFLDDSQTIVFFHMDILNNASSILNLRSKLYWELVDLIAFLKGPFETFNENPQALIQETRRQISEIIKVPDFLDWENSVLMVAKETGCRDQIRLTANPFNGRLSLAFVSTGKCPNLFLTDPIRDLSFTKITEGLLDYQCQINAGGKVTCFP